MIDEGENTVKGKHNAWFSVPRYFSVFCVVAIGFTLSLVLFWVIHTWERTTQQYEFESRAKSYANALEATLNEYVDAILFLGDYFDNSSSVSRQDFRRVVISLLPHYPGIQTIGWNLLVKDRERDRYESLARQDGFEDYQFTERADSQNLVRAERRDEYMPVYYMYPLKGNEAAFGFDIASDTTRLSAITKAFASGKLSATERITLVQETADQYGVLLIRPVYHQGNSLDTHEQRFANRQGTAVEVLRIGDLIEAARKGFEDEGISLTLYDMSADEGKRLLHHRPSMMLKTIDQPIPPEGNKTGLFWGKTIDIADRQWKVVLRPSDFYHQSRWIWQSWLILAASLLMTTFLALYLLRKILYEAEIKTALEKQAQTNKLLKEEIAVRTAAEAERDQTIHQLQHAIDEVKTLRGILPICASCKKIRDDQGYWNQIESYISDHSEAAFSHGICPDCAKQLYPDLHK